MAPSKDPFAMKDPFARKSIMQSHFQDNQPPLLASKFLSYASDAAAHEAEAHGRPHVPEPTYLTLVLEDCLPIERVKNVVNSQVPELEPVMEEQATLGLSDEEEEVKICRIRGAVKGWYNVFQDILTDDGDVFYLKRVSLFYRDQTVDGYRPTDHFPRPRLRSQKGKSMDSTPRSKSVGGGQNGRQKSTLGRYLHWHRKSQNTPRSQSIS